MRLSNAAVIPFGALQGRVTLTHSTIRGVFGKQLFWMSLAKIKTLSPGAYSDYVNISQNLIVFFKSFWLSVGLVNSNWIRAILDWQKKTHPRVFFFPRTPCSMSTSSHQPLIQETKILHMRGVEVSSFLSVINFTYYALGVH